MKEEEEEEEEKEEEKEEVNLNPRSLVANSGAIQCGISHSAPAPPPRRHCHK